MPSHPFVVCAKRWLQEKHHESGLSEPLDLHLGLTDIYQGKRGREKIAFAGVCGNQYILPLADLQPHERDVSNCRGSIFQDLYMFRQRSTHRFLCRAIETTASNVLRRSFTRVSNIPYLCAQITNANRTSHHLGIAPIYISSIGNMRQPWRTLSLSLQEPPVLSMSVGASAPISMTYRPLPLRSKKRSKDCHVTLRLLN